MTMTAKGAIACGHPETATAGEEIIRDGGNALDAAIAALLTACVAEPVLASLGGGGFLLARRSNGETRLFDFFAQTPGKAHPEPDFHATHADFGTATQAFHIGLGAAAVPGMPAGIVAMHEWGGSMPLPALAEHAISAARRGIEINHFQGNILDIVRPIYEATPAAHALYGRDVASTGQLMRQPALADTLEHLATEGAAFFYRGEIGERIARVCGESGGHLRRQDLEDYRVIEREPLAVEYRDHQIVTNPPPSAGGRLIQFALALTLEQAQRRSRRQPSPGGDGHLVELIEIMRATGDARQRLLEDPGSLAPLLAVASDALGRFQVTRGTTHISTIDSSGGAASLTVSNGEGCGSMIPDTGIMLNNMLGESDINPHGIGRWPVNERLGSMMAPTLACRGSDCWVLGSGGSNRIRSAIYQVLCNLLDFEMSAANAVNAPRAHLEEQLLSLEPGFDLRHINEDSLAGYGLTIEQWDQPSLFFGGVHLAGTQAGSLVAMGDPRRGGVGRVVG
jgi:gamma-glutamyltranspeptidase/glutathione hydrolase